MNKKTIAIEFRNTIENN